MGRLDTRPTSDPSTSTKEPETAREKTLSSREVAVSARESVVAGREHAMSDRESAVSDREGAAAIREDAVHGREAALRARAEIDALLDQLRDANEHLVLANVRAQTLAERAQHLAAIVESSDDAIIAVDLDGVITSWNRGAERLYGYPAQEAIGQSVAMLMPLDRPGENATILDRIRSGKAIEHHETVRCKKDGTRRDVSLTISPIADAQGQTVGASKIARDITDRKQAEQERAELLRREQMARLEAETANRLKDEFLATVSHELRTPLNAVLGWARMVTSKQLRGPRVTHAIETVERNAASLARLIDDLLDVSRIVAGTLNLASEPVDLIALSQTAMDIVKPLAESKHINLQLSVDSKPLDLVNGDTERLQQVIGNLLTNAIKFTPDGGRVELSVDRVDTAIQVTVADTGQGIAADFLPHVFERFRQAEGGTMRQHGGLGLGLAIVRQLVELHCGTVQAASGGEGLGATFTVRLPIPGGGAPIERWPADGERRREASATSPLHRVRRLDGLHILVVDDNLDGRNLTALLLRQAGAIVKDVGSAGEALQALATQRPDVLISDIGLPDDDGYALIHHIRQQEAERSGLLPAIALTGYARGEDRTHVLAAGFQGHVAKPFEPAELIATIAGLAQAANEEPPVRKVKKRS